MAKNGIFTSEIEISTLLRNFFLGVCGFFLRNVGGFLGEVERLKVKRYLFSRPHFLGGGKRIIEKGGRRIKEEGRGKAAWISLIPQPY